MSALRTLFGYLIRMGALTKDPTREVALPKLDDARRLLVVDNDLVQLLEAAQRQHSGFRCERDGAILADRSLLIPARATPRSSRGAARPDTTCPGQVMQSLSGAGSAPRSLQTKPT
jgi:hypothetical protein